jgi:hypothetical protein
MLRSPFCALPVDAGRRLIWITRASGAQLGVGGGSIILLNLVGG